MKVRTICFALGLLLLSGGSDADQIRLTQIPIEMVLQQDSIIRLTQQPVEVLLAQDSALRVSQVTVEVALPDNSFTAAQPFSPFLTGP